jgi:hypothetical protein
LLYKTLPERLSAVNHCQKFGGTLKGKTQGSLVEDAREGLKTQGFRAARARRKILARKFAGNRNDFELTRALAL